MSGFNFGGAPPPDGTAPATGFGGGFNFGPQGAAFGTNPANGAFGAPANGFGGGGFGQQQHSDDDEFTGVSNRSCKLGNHTLEVEGVQKTAISCLSLTNPIDGDSRRILAAGSWDGTVRLWSGRCDPFGDRTIIPKAQAKHPGPILSTDLSLDGSTLYTGSVDNTARVWQLDHFTPEGQLVGYHNAPVKSVKRHPANPNLMITGSWDHTVKVWDVRQPGSRATTSVDLQHHGRPKRVAAMDIGDRSEASRPFSWRGFGHFVVVALSGRNDGTGGYSGGPPGGELPQNQIYELGPNGEMELKESRTTPLRHQTRTVACFGGKNPGFTLGSIEGRCGVCYIHDSGKDFAFKAHRSGPSNRVIHPVNAVSYSAEETFATAGGDGGVSTWDHSDRKRLKNFDRINGCISAATFAPRSAAHTESNRLFAYAVSYDWSKGPARATRGPYTTPPRIFLHEMEEANVRKYGSGAR